MLSNFNVPNEELKMLITPCEPQIYIKFDYTYNDLLTVQIYEII